MNISQIAVTLTGEDVKTIINDFVKVEGLNLKTIEFVEDNLVVTGAFKKIITLGFSAMVEIVGVKDNILTLNFKKASLMNIGVLKVFRKLALKIALKGFKEKGITIANEEINVDVKKILSEIKFVDLEINEAKVANGKLEVTLNNLSLNLPEMMKKPTVTVEEKIDEVKEEKNLIEATDKNSTSYLEEEDEEELEFEERKDDYIYNIDIEKKDDVYSHSREAIINNIPEKAKGYSDIIMFIPDLVALVCRLLKDKRVPKKTRLALAISLGYTVIPIDIIPDKFPILGQIDDIAIIMFALERIVSDIDTEVLLENWQGRNELVIVLKQAVDYISGFTGAKNLNKIYNVIDSLT